MSDEAKPKFIDPTWPEQTFAELLLIAFRDQRIDSLDHPAVICLRYYPSEDEEDDNV